MKKMIAAVGLVAATLLAGCGIGGSASAPSKAAASMQVSGKTTVDKAFSIKNIVSEKNKDFGLFLVSDVQLSGGLTLMASDGMEPIWYALATDEPTPDAVANTRGLLFTISVTKARSFMSPHDMDTVHAAVGDIFSLVAKNFFQGSSKEFSFVEVDVVNPPESAAALPFSFLSIEVYHTSAEDLIEERDKGTEADWLVFAVGKSPIPPTPGDPGSPGKPGKQLRLAPILIPLQSPNQQANPSSSASPSSAPGA